jgi:type I restriction enzyme S subunit
VKHGVSGQTKFTEQSFDESVRVRRGDLIFSWSGQPETSIDAFWWQGTDGWLNQHLFRVTPIPAMDRTFFFYLLRYLKPSFIGIARNKQTTGLGHITRRDLENIVVAYPPLAEQRAIAEVLGALDDKIEANRRVIQTAWSLAEVHFRRVTEADGVDHVPLSELADLSYGKSLPERARQPGSVPVFGSGGVVGYHSSALVTGPGVIVGRKGTAGAVHWCQSDFFPIDTTFYVQSDHLPMAFLYFVLRSLGLDRMNFDSAVPGLNRSAALARLVPTPNSEEIDSFAPVASSLTTMVAASERESALLAATRDAILPKLLSGELRVRDAETVVKGAV